MCMCQTPWFVKLLLEFVDPGAPLRNLARKMVTDRLKGGSNVRDLYYYLVCDYFLIGASSPKKEQGRENSTKRKQTDEELNDDGFVAIIAGSVFLALMTFEWLADHVCIQFRYDLLDVGQSLDLHHDGPSNLCSAAERS